MISPNKVGSDALLEEHCSGSDPQHVPCLQACDKVPFHKIICVVLWLATIESLDLVRSGNATTSWLTDLLSDLAAVFLLVKWG